MATEQRVFVDGSMTAVADLRTHQYKYVKVAATANTVDVCAATTDKAIGVLQNKPNIGEVAEVMILGRTKLLAGAAVATPGTELGPDATGRAIAAVTATRALGVNITTAAAAAGVMEVLLIQGRLLP